MRSTSPHAGEGMTHVGIFQDVGIFPASPPARSEFCRHRPGFCRHGSPCGGPLEDAGVAARSVLEEVEIGEALPRKRKKQGFRLARGALRRAIPGLLEATACD